MLHLTFCMVSINLLKCVSSCPTTTKTTTITTIYENSRNNKTTIIRYKIPLRFKKIKIKLFLKKKNEINNIYY